jgi:hypothetical protein
MPEQDVPDRKNSQHDCRVKPKRVGVPHFNSICLKKMMVIEASELGYRPIKSFRSRYGTEAGIREKAARKAWT